MTRARPSASSPAATPAPAVRVLVVDDHPVVRLGLKMFLLTQPDIELIGEAASGQDGIQMALQTQPDVVLMDLVMPDLDGLAAIRAIRSALPETQVLALTSFVDAQRVTAVLEAGAIGYLLKEIAAPELAKAIRGASEGRPQIHPEALRCLEPSQLPHGSLTERERAVLRELAAGRSNKEIAAALAISLPTVKGHLASILDKLGVADRTQAAVYAVRHGLAPQ